MPLESAYPCFVGLAVAARSATLAWRSASSRPGSAQTVPQTAAGHHRLRSALPAAGAIPAQTLVVLEATSTSWLVWATQVRRAGLVVSVVTPRQAQHFAQAHLHHDKTDASEAQSLADLAAQHQPAPWTPPPAL